MFFYPLALRPSFLAAWAVACLHLAGMAWADTQQHAAAHHQNSTGTAIPFSAEQVTYGAQIYAGTCAICHGINLEGGHDVPDLGDYFTARWANTPLDQLAGYIARAMPLMAPGTLSPRDTVALVAFLLHQNGVSPSSNTPLPVDEHQLAKLHFPATRNAATARPALNTRKNTGNAQ